MKRMLRAALFAFVLGGWAQAKEITDRAEFLPEDNWTERSAFGSDAR